MATVYERLRRRIGSRRGFSLAETLLAVLILLLVSVIVVSGMPAATNAYNKVVLGANARTMLSTVVTALHDELGTAWGVEGIDDKTITYFNAGNGAKSKISCTQNEYIMIQNNLTLDLIHSDGAQVGESYELVSGKGYIPRMYVTYKTIDYSNGIVSVEELKVCRSDDDTVLATFSDSSGEAVDFTIRVISAGFDD